jgi:hypothetical protein
VEKSLALVMFGFSAPIMMAMGSAIRLVAILTSGIVLLGFAFFAIDEMDRGSQNQQNALDSEIHMTEDVPPIAPSPRVEALRESRNGDFRELVDDANDVLLMPTLLGLLTYGLLLGVVANMLPKRRETHGDWRTA